MLYQLVEKSNKHITIYYEVTYFVYSNNLDWVKFDITAIV